MLARVNLPSVLFSNPWNPLVLVPLFLTLDDEIVDRDDENGLAAEQ